MRFSVVCVLALCLFAASAAAHEVQLFAGGSGCSSTPTRHLSVTDNACYLTPDARQSLLVLCGADGNAAFTVFDTLDCSGDAAAQIASGSGKGDGNTCIASSSASIQAKVQCVSQRCTKTALVAMSSASQLLMTRADGTTFYEPIGYYLPEAYYPVKAMLDAGWDLTFANPQGNTPPMDPTSDNPWYFAYNQTESDLAKDLLITRGVSNFKKPYRYQDLTIEQVAKFDALIVPGGHAPMVDLTNDPSLGKIILQFYQSKKPIAAICHGPVAFLSAKSAFQPWIFENTTLTVFTDAADIYLESPEQWNATMPFLPGSKLRAENITVLASQQLFEPIVLQDRNIITGENPMSAPIFGQIVTAEVYRYCGIQVAPVQQAQDTPSSGPSKGALAGMLIGAAAAGAAVTALVLYLLARNAREKEVHMHMQPLV